MPDVGGAALRRFGFQQSAVVARWAEMVGEQYAQHCTPDALSFPTGKRSGGTLRSPTATREPISIPTSIVVVLLRTSIDVSLLSTRMSRKRRSNSSIVVVESSTSR